MKTVTQIADAFVDDYAAADPVYASRSMGLGRDSVELTDYSPEGIAVVASVMRRTLSDLEGTVADDESERLGRGYLQDLCSARLALIDAGETQRLVSALIGPPAMVRMCFDVMPSDNDDDWERMATRLAAVPAAMAGYRSSLTESTRRGHVPARRLVDEVAKQCATWSTGWFQSIGPRYGEGPVRSLIDRAATSAAASYDELSTWLRDDFAKLSTDREGVGAERYRTWATLVLGAELDTDESYDWGVEELARLEAEKAIECERIVPGASFDEVRHFLESDDADAVLGVDAYRAALQEILDEAISGIAGTEFDIVPELRRCDVGIPPAGTALAPYYSPPSEDLSQPATTWFPAAGRDRFAMWDQHTTVYHEAVPGHHLQLGLIRILPLVRAQRVGGNTAHAEGWALYAERLMDELGWFRTPATRLGFLNMQAFRAARVVVDIGLHTGRGGWTYDRAVDAIEQAGGISRAFAESEVTRYLSWPSQATAYKLGERAWLDGRAAAMAATGENFDRKAWHSRALALGPLGLTRLQSELASIATSS